MVVCVYVESCRLTILHHAAEVASLLGCFRCREVGGNGELVLFGDRLCVLVRNPEGGLGGGGYGSRQLVLDKV